MKMYGKMIFAPGLITGKEFLGKSFDAYINKHKARILLPEFSGDLTVLGFLSCPNQLDNKMFDISNYNSNKWGIIAEMPQGKRKSVKVQINAAGIIFDNINPDDEELKDELHDALNEISRTINIIGLISNRTFLPGIDFPQTTRERIQLTYKDNDKLEYYFEPVTNLQTKETKIKPMYYSRFKDSFIKLSKGYILNPVYDIFYHAVQNIRHKNYRMAAIDMGTCMDLFLDYIVGNYLERFIEKSAVNTMLSGLYNFKKKRIFINNTSYFNHKIPNFDFIKERNKAVHEFKQPPASLLHKEIYEIYDLLAKFGIPLLLKDKKSK